MRKLMFSLMLSVLLSAQVSVAQTKEYVYEPSPEFPYGRPNPDAPEQLSNFTRMIGTCDCLSQNRNSDGSWQEQVEMTWTFKYIMNGKAIQDETWKSNGQHSGSIRQFNADSLKWYVHYYTSVTVSPRLTSWAGAKEGDKIVLSTPQKAPNGMDGVSRLTFYDISESGFKWIGEWVKEDASIVYPFWKIECKKRL